MKNLYAAFLCILGVLTVLTKGQAKDLSGGPDTAYITPIAAYYLPAHSSNDSLTQRTGDDSSVNLQAYQKENDLSQTKNYSASSKQLAPPANDNFANATNVTGSINAACVNTGVYTNVGAT